MKDMFSKITNKAMALFEKGELEFTNGREDRGPEYLVTILTPDGRLKGGVVQIDGMCTYPSDPTLARIEGWAKGLNSYELLVAIVNKESTVCGEIYMLESTDRDMKSGYFEFEIPKLDLFDEGYYPRFLALP